MVLKQDYARDAVQAAQSVMLELARILGKYKNDIAIVGGWVPYLLLGDRGKQHIGSTDVDIALNHLTLQEVGYQSIAELLTAHDYVMGSQPFIFYRTLLVNGRELRVQVDLLAGEYEGSGANRRTQLVQDVKHRKARGCDLVFTMAEKIRIEGVLPNGGIDSAEIQVASIVPFLVMKGITMSERLKEKDAWDIYFCLCNYPGGLDELALAFQPHVHHGLVKEGLQVIAEKFASSEHVGAVHVARFEQITDEEERAICQQDAYQRVSYLLGQIEADQR
jgi:hypothetical protein